MNDSNLGGRLPLLHPGGLDPTAKALYDRLLGRLGSGSPFRSRTDLGELIGPFNACLHAPAMGEGFIGFHEAEERSTPLTMRLREVVILSVGAVWKSAYELYAHTSLSQRAGFAPGVVAALAAGEPSDGLSVEESAAQRFTLELVRDRRVRDDAYGTAERVLGPEGVVALVFLAAAYVSTCMVLNAFEVPAPALT